jgi:SSS family solute:Na+ symporter
MMGVSWGALAGAFLAPLLYGLYSKNTTKASVFVSFAFGVGLEIVQLLCDFGVLSINGGFLGFVFTNSLYSGVFAMVGGLILVPVVSLFTKKMEKAKTDEIFSCYNEEVKVLTKQSLGK